MFIKLWLFFFVKKSVLIVLFVLVKMADSRLKALHGFSGRFKEVKWSQFPKNYKIGKTKYIFVTGGVISGVGKGIASGSIAQLLQCKDLVCNPIKLESYYNIDSGTLNPFEHGEVFVLDDGLETDMDLGSYEALLNKNLSRNNFFTNGMVEVGIHECERKGLFDGKTVQFFPHKVGAVNRKIRESSMNSNADVTLVEIGGKVGDEESRIFFKAMQTFAYEEGKENIFFVHNVYVDRPAHLNEQKTWPAQQSIDEFSALIGSKPDLVVVRSESELDSGVREKIGVRGLIGAENVVSLPNSKSIYLVAQRLKRQLVDRKIVSYFRFNGGSNKRLENAWRKYVHKFLNPKHELTVGITGKYVGSRDTYASIIKAVEHAGTFFDVNVNLKFIDTELIEKGKLKVEDELAGVSGIIVPGGFGIRGTEGKIRCIRFARENNLPYFGLCYGFQMAVIEIARDVCNLNGANTQENFADLKHPVICLLPDQYEKEGLGGNMRLGGHDVKIRPETKAFELYNNRGIVRERFRHRYEFNPEYKNVLEKSGVVFSGMNKSEDIMQILELPNHPFFVGVQFHPEFSSKPLQPNPLYLGFIKAALCEKLNH